MPHNLMRLAPILRQVGGIPGFGGKRGECGAGSGPDPDPERR